MRIYRKSPNIKDAIEPTLQKHLENLNSNADEKRKEQIGSEVASVNKVLAVDAERAQNVEDPWNFPEIKPVCINEWLATNSLHKALYGDRYVGAGVDNGRIRDGEGVYKWENKDSAGERFSGDCYSGTYRDNKRNGKGTYCWKNGDKYVGEWKNGKMDGRGVYTQASGNKYDGEYKEHLREGQGTFIWADGEKYDGQWKGGLKHGPGKYYKADRSAGWNPKVSTWINDVMQEDEADK